MNKERDDERIRQAAAKQIEQAVVLAGDMLRLQQMSVGDELKAILQKQLDILTPLPWN